MPATFPSVFCPAQRQFYALCLVALRPAERHKCNAEVNASARVKPWYISRSEVSPKRSLLCVCETSLFRFLESIEHLVASLGSSVVRALTETTGYPCAATPRPSKARKLSKAAVAAVACAADIVPRSEASWEKDLVRRSVRSKLVSEIRTRRGSHRGTGRSHRTAVRRPCRPGVGSQATALHPKNWCHSRSH